MNYKTIQKCYAWNSWLHCQITKRIKISKTLQLWNPNTRKAKLDLTSFMDYKTSPKLPSCDSKRQPKYSWNPKLHDQVTKWNSNLYSNILLMVMQIQTTSSKFPSCTPKQHNQVLMKYPNFMNKLQMESKPKSWHFTHGLAIQNLMTKVLLKLKSAWTSEWQKWNPNLWIDTLLMDFSSAHIKSLWRCIRSQGSGGGFRGLVTWSCSLA